MAQKGVGIICEYNPFHNGHKHQIDTLRSMGFDEIVCVMSGDFVQRGDVCFQDKNIRAKNAVENGADLVLELPFPFSSMSAEGFAMGGVEIIAKSGLCSHIAFGSECADVEKLTKIARLLDKSFTARISLIQKENPSMSFASAREFLIGEELGEEYKSICKNPNDILAIEYIKANLRLGCPLIPVAVKRSTPRGGFDENFASSSYIRKMFSDGSAENPFALSSMPESVNLGGLVENTDRFYTALLASVLLKTPDELSCIAEVSKGFEHSIIKNALAAKNYGELCSLLASKTVTDAKIRRMLLFSFMGVTKDMATKSPLYTEILALGEKGRDILKKYSDNKDIIIASRTGEIKRNPDAYLQYSFARRSREVLYKCIGRAPLI